MVASIVLCVPPSAVMLLMSFLAYAVKVPPIVMSAAQHLAAGLVMCAVAVELCPILSAAPTDAPSIMAIIIGFFTGLTVFLLLGAFCEAEEEEEEEQEQSESAPAPAGGGLFAKLLNQPGEQAPPELKEMSPRSKLRAAIKAVKAANRIKGTITPGRRFSKMHESRKICKACEERGAAHLPAFPFTFAVAVCVDAFVDGFLIGISQASGGSAGAVMSAALTIEMGFLGLTFAAAMGKQRRAVALAAVCLPPLILMLGGVGGTLAAEGLSHFPALHVGLISFGIAALLFLVTEELLLEAHHVLEETGAENTWWVTLMFFVGFLGAFLIEKVVDSFE